MNESTRERIDLQSGGTAAGTNVELETTTTTLEQNGPTGSAAHDGEVRNATERAKAEGEQIRQRAGQAGEQVRRTAAEAGEQVRRRTRETAELVRGQAAEQAAAMKHRAVEQIDSQKNGLACRICDVSGALKRAAEDLDQHEDHQLAAQARRIAEGIEGVGSHLRDSQVTDLLEDAENFVRRHPTLTLGGLFVAGLTVARFLKARPPRYQSVGFQAPTGGPAGRAQSGGAQSGGASAGGGVNPYLQRQREAMARPSHDHELTVGSSDLKVGSTDPTAGPRMRATPSGMGTKPGDMPGGTAGHAASAGITPATRAEANRLSTDSAGCPTPAANQPQEINPQEMPSQEIDPQAANPQGINPQLGPSGNRTPGGSAPRPR